MLIQLDAVIWPMVSALAACIALFVTAWFNIKNLRATRLSNSAKMVIDISVRFNSPDMRAQRSRLARHLLNQSLPYDISGDSPPLELFEEVGFMTRRGVLDRAMVWNSFFWPLQGYFHAMTDGNNLIAQARTQTNALTLYRELEWLFNELCNVEKREARAAVYMPPTAERVRQFLEAERLIATAGPVDGMGKGSTSDKTL